MRKILLLVAMIVIVMACNKKGTSVKVTKSVDRYELIAEYPEQQTEKVTEVLKSVFKNRDSLLLTKSVSEGKEIILANGATFYLRYNPRKLEIEMLKEKNNLKGRQFFDEMTNEIKKVLK